MTYPKMWCFQVVLQITVQKGFSLKISKDGTEKLLITKANIDQWIEMIRAYKDRKWCQKSKSWNDIVNIILKKGGSGDSWWGLFQVPCVGVWLSRKGTYYY